MSDIGVSDIGINFFSVGLIRYRTRGLQSDKFLSDIGLGCIGVGYRISATKIFDVAPTYDARTRPTGFTVYTYIICGQIFLCNV
jgi:hypothetical protein